MTTKNFTSAVAMYIDLWNAMRSVCHSHDLSRGYGEESLLLVNASRNTGGVMLTIHPHEVLKLRAFRAITPLPHTS